MKRKVILAWVLAIAVCASAIAQKGKVSPPDTVPDPWIREVPVASCGAFSVLSVNIADIVTGFTASGCTHILIEQEKSGRYLVIGTKTL